MPRTWKPSLTVAFTLIATAILLFADLVAVATAQPGKPAPNFSLEASDGKTYSLSDFQGKFVVLEWFNKDCPFTRKHYDSGNMQKLQGIYQQKGVAWLSICSSAPGKQGYLNKEDAVRQRVADKVRSTATLLDPDGKVGLLYGAKTTPHMFVINPKGIVVYAGAIDDHASADAADISQSKNYVAMALDQAMAGQPVQTPSTPPYGCSIKYK